MALYPYTMQPIAVNLTEAEFREAQNELFAQATPSFSLRSLKPKEWAIIAVTVILAVAGIVYFESYSTILFWIMLVLVAIYLLVRTIGMKWYVKKEYEKQINEQEMPDEMRQLKLGIQKHGLIMAMPAPNAGMVPKAQRGMQMRAGQVQSATIPWSAVKSWDETADYFVIMFELKDQKGSQIVPKRLQKDNFPLDTLRNHLSEVVPLRGLSPETMGQ